MIAFDSLARVNKHLYLTFRSSNDGSGFPFDYSIIHKAINIAMSALSDSALDTEILTVRLHVMEQVIAKAVQDET